MVGLILSCLSLVDGDPVRRGEPLVILYVIHAVLQVSKSLRQVDLKQISQQILQVGAEVRGEPDLQARRRKEERDHTDHR